MSCEIDYSQTPVTYVDIECFTQGVEIKNLSRRRAVSSLPIIFSGREDFYIETQDFGIVAQEDTLTPFSDKRGRILPAEVLDVGWQTFEEIQSYHSEDISTRNGAIEPLAIRSLLTSDNCERPGQRTIKGDIGFLSVNSRPSPVQEDWYDVLEQGSSGNAFIDSQDQFFGNPMTGYSGMSAPQPAPFRDSQTVKSVLYTGRYFREGSEFGDSRRSRGRGFTYDNCDVGTDSIAYGGLKR